MNSIITVALIASVFVLALLAHKSSELWNRIMSGRNLKVFNPLPILEVVLFIIFILWSVNYIIGNSTFNNVISQVISVFIFALLSWYWLRDYLAGIVIRSQVKLWRGQNITAGNIRGTIRKFGWLHTDIVTEEGSVKHIPYTKLRTEVITENQPSQQASYYHFELEVAKSFNLEDGHTIENMIMIAILNMPWNPPGRIPIIKKTGETHDKYNYNITINVLNEKHASFIETQLKNKYEH